MHSKGDMHVQKKKKNNIFVYSYPCLLNPDVYFHMIYIIRKASYSISYVLIYLHITTVSYHMPNHPCLSLIYCLHCVVLPMILIQHQVMQTDIDKSAIRENKIVFNWIDDVLNTW